MVIFALPTDLSQAVFREWLGNIKDITRLDSACTPSVRELFLDLARRPAGLGVPYPVKLIKENVSGFVHWTNDRQLEFEFELSLAKNGLAACTAISPTVLMQVRQVEINGHYSDCWGFGGDLSSTFCDLLMLMPCLETLYLRSCSGLLAVLPRLPQLPLKSLSVQYLTNIDHDLITVCSTFGDTLERLIVCNDAVEYLESETLRRIGQSCKKLKVLELHMENLEESLLNFAFDGYFPGLKQLALAGSTLGNNGQSQITDNIAVQICKSHPQLTHFLCGESAVALSSLTTMLSYCSKLEHVITGNLEFSIFFESSRHYAALEIRSDDDSVAQELPKIASLLPCPLTHFFHYTSSGSSKAALYESLAVQRECGCGRCHFATFGESMLFG